MFAELWQDSDKLLLRLDLPPGANPGVILHDGNAYVRKAADSCEYRKAEVYTYVPPTAEELIDLLRSKEAGK